HVRIDQRPAAIEQLHLHDDRLVAHPLRHDVEEVPAGDLERLDRLPRALAALLADDLERAVADQASEPRTHILELGVGPPVLGGADGDDLDLDGVRGGRGREDRSDGEQDDGRTRRRRHGWAAGALTMMSVVPYFRSRRSSRRAAPLSMRSMTAWFGR